MQKVSEEWKYVHQKQLLNESFIRISFDVTDPEAFADAKSSDNGACYISNTSEVVNGLIKSVPCYAGIEKNLWLLDGSRTFIPNDFGKNMGYISEELSRADSFFDKVPVVSIKFSKTHSHIIPGITILWGTAYDEYAENFNVKAYQGSGLVASKEIKGNNSKKSIVDLDIENYDRIEIEIIKWCLPYHRARIADIFIGVNKLYEKNELLSYEHEMSREMLNANTPVNKMSFSIDNSDDVYDPNNLTGFSKYLMQRQEMQVEYGLKLDDGSIEYIPAGLFYLSEWEAPQNGLEARFTARDIFEFLQKPYTKGLYNPNGTTLYDLAVDVFNEANLPLKKDGGKRWFVSTKLKNYKTTAPIPCVSLAECLQYIANASCHVLCSNRDGVLALVDEGVPVSTDIELTHFNLISRPEIILQKPLKAVNTNIYNYFIDVEEKQKELFNGSLNVKSGETVIIKYSDMATNVKAISTSRPIKDIKYYSYCCHVSFTSSGNVDIKLVGDVLKNSVSTYVENVNNEGEVETIENPLITDTNMAKSVSRVTTAILNMRKNLKIEAFRADVRLDPLDVIEVENKFGKEKVTITNLKYAFTGAFRGSAEGKVGA